MASITPETPAEQDRYDLAPKLLDDVRRLDAQTKESDRRIRVAVKASGTSVTELYGVGPIIAAQLIGYAGDVRRFANRDAFCLLQRDGPDRTVLRRPCRASALTAREPTAQPRHPHGDHLSDPPERLERPAPTSSARLPKARQRRKRSAPSSAR